MIKVLHVISDTGIGGAGTHLCNLLSCIDRSRFDISVCLPKNSLLIPRLCALGIPIIETQHGADRSADPLAIPELMRILRCQKPQILHTHSALYARLAGFLCRPPISVNTRHCADTEAKPTPLERLTVGCLARVLGNHTVATADYVKDFLTARNVPHARVHIIHNGACPLPAFSEEKNQALRRELGLSDRHFTVGMVARLAVGKGHETFIHAASRCSKSSPHIRFLIVGDGERANALRALVHRLGLDGCVIFTGFRADVAPIMNILHLNVNCSERSETSSLSLSEGMSLGVVPVVSDCGGNAYMAGFGENGAVFPVGDAAALADTVLSLERDRPRLAALSQRCRNRFERDFTASGMTRKLELLYEQLMESKR